MLETSSVADAEQSAEESQGSKNNQECVCLLENVNDFKEDTKLKFYRRKNSMPDSEILTVPQKFLCQNSDYFRVIFCLTFLE